MWLTYTWVLVVALAAAGNHWMHDDWITDPETGKLYIAQSVRQRLTRAQLQQECENIGGFFPEPKTEEENEFVRSSITVALRYLPWLGVTKENGIWKWNHDGARVEWFPWGSNEPNFVDRINCLTMNMDGSWRGEPCGTAGIKHFICEKAPPVGTKVPESTPITEPNENKPEWKTDPRTGKRYIDLNQRGQPRGGNQQACIDIGAYLPEPRSIEENDFLTSLTTKDFRLGMSYIKAQGLWRWDHEGSKVSWSNWITQSGAPVKPCAAMIQTAYFTGWVQVDCSSTDATATVVCQKDVDFAAAGADGYLQPPALLISVALGLCHLIHFM